MSRFSRGFFHENSLSFVPVSMPSRPKLRRILAWAPRLTFLSTAPVDQIRTYRARHKRLFRIDLSAENILVLPARRCRASPCSPPRSLQCCDRRCSYHFAADHIQRHTYGYSYRRFLILFHRFFFNSRRVSKIARARILRIVFPECKQLARTESPCYIGHHLIPF